MEHDMRLMGLLEIDTYATNAKHWNEVNGEEERLILDTMQPGSNWTKPIILQTGGSDGDT